MDGTRRSRAASVAAHLLACCAVGLLVWLAFGRTAFVNYDSAWSLDWMRQLLAGGSRPDLERLFSPTPHPLSDLFSGLLVPLSDGGGPAVGRGAETALVVFAMFWIGALGVVTFRLGAAWFGTAAGVVAAVVVLTREPVLSYGLRTYLDLPYAVFLLLALLAETRRPRNGARTMVWITLAGLLRPEAWLLAAAYVGYLVVARVREDAAVHGDAATGQDAEPDGGRPTAGDGAVEGNAAAPSRPRTWLAAADVRSLLPLIALSLVAPLGWIVEGLVLAGDPLQALTGTQQNAADLDRVTGVGSAITVMPRRLGEIVREPVLLAAVGGVVLSLAFLRRRAVLGVGAAIAAGAAFFVLAAAGLPLLTRYLVFPATLLIVFAAAGLLGWRHLEADHRWRRPWQAFAVVALLAFVVFLPSQVHRLDRLQAALSLQQRVIGDLRDVTGEVVRPSLGACGIGVGDTASGDGAVPGIAYLGDVDDLRDAEREDSGLLFERLQPAVGLPNHRAVPQVLLWLGQGGGVGDRPPSVQALPRPGDDPRTRAGDPRITLLPSSEQVARGFILDKADNGRGLPTAPRGAIRAGTLGTWTVYGAGRTCAAALRDRLTR
ncbi:hypothetical protein [Patulibacter sp.]|uniref:hypothetical protein n=1 Tax=Patulibacter sp. TaxID=1912859 RepID=UPI00271EAB66|nr:hypothetical protein [Patulibacter sp.]MDO9407766.1 hypothetical protein [Patulibacter sp.]